MDAKFAEVVRKLLMIKFASETDPLTRGIIDTLLDSKESLGSLRRLPRLKRIIWQCNNCPSMEMSATFSTVRRTTAFLYFPMPVLGTDNDFTSVRQMFKAAASLLVRVARLSGLEPVPSLFILPGLQINKSSQPGYMIWDLLKLPFLQYRVETLRAVITLGLIFPESGFDYLLFGYSACLEVHALLPPEELKVLLLENDRPQLESALLDAVYVNKEIGSLLLE